MRRSIALLSLLSPFTALAEVLDKAPTHGSLALISITGSAITFASVVRKPKLLFLLLPALGLVYGLQIAELHDPYIGPALIKEGGASYALLSWLGPVLTVVALILGLVIRRRLLKHL